MDLIWSFLPGKTAHTQMNGCVFVRFVWHDKLRHVINIIILTVLIKVQQLGIIFIVLVITPDIAL
jgi:hypothetical protein